MMALAGGGPVSAPRRLPAATDIPGAPHEPRHHPPHPLEHPHPFIVFLDGPLAWMNNNRLVGLTELPVKAFPR